MKMVGVIEAVKKDNKAIKVGGVWYSSFLPMPPMNAGDEVAFDYTEKGPYKNIKGSVSVSKSDGGTTVAGVGTFPTKKVGAIILDRDRAIIRQNALTAAVNFHALSDSPGPFAVTEQHIIETAKLFEAYTSGDMDLAEAKEAMKEIQDE